MVVLPAGDRAVGRFFFVAGNSSMNGYAHVDTWSFFYAPLGSVIDVSTVLGPDGMSFVTRTVGARVQTDFTDFVAGVPPRGEFAKPKSCVHVRP